MSPDARLADLLVELRDLRGGFSRSELGVGYDEAEQEGRIIADVRALALDHPRHVPTLVANASLAFEAADPVGAQKYLDQALRVEPRHIDATLLRVRIAAEAGNLPYARRRLEELLDLTPDEASLHEALAGVLYLDGEYERATRELELAARLRETTVPGGVTDYHRGLVAEAAGDLDAARAHYRRSLELDPDFEPAARRWRWLEYGAPEGEPDSGTAP